LIKPEFILGQCYLGKQETFGEKIVGDRKLLEHVFLLQQFFQLFETFRHKKQFQWKSELLRVGVKFREKRVVSKFFQYQSRVIMFTQQVGKGGLTGSDIALYGNEVIVHGSQPQK